VSVLLERPNQPQRQWALQRLADGDRKLVTADERGRQREKEFVHEILSQHRVEQDRATFAKEGPDIVLTAQRPQHISEFAFGGRYRVRGDLSGAIRDHGGGRCVERYSGAAIREQRDVERNVSAPADDDRQRLNGPALSEAHFHQALVAHEKSVALHAQGSGAGEYRVNLGTQQVESGSVAVAAKRRRASTGGRFAVRAAHEVADHIRPIGEGSFGQGKPRVNVFGRGRGTRRNGSLEQHQPGRVAIMDGDPMSTAEEIFTRMTGSLDYPMLVVTVIGGNERAGCLVGFATQCSINPPRFIVCLSDKNHSSRVAASASSLAVHFLPAAAFGLARLFGSETGDDVDKFSRCRWHAGPGGLPILDEGGRWFAGTIIERHTVGDHVAYVLQPFAASDDGNPASLRFSQAKELKPGHEA
jgi:flavin reductase (DIM6/NTAB) family NADH-FMN oxidoreductase RutF